MGRYYSKISECNKVNHGLLYTANKGKKIVIEGETVKRERYPYKSFVPYYTQLKVLESSQWKVTQPS